MLTGIGVAAGVVLFLMSRPMEKIVARARPAHRLTRETQREGPGGRTARAFRAPRDENILRARAALLGFSMGAGGRRTRDAAAVLAAGR